MNNRNRRQFLRMRLRWNPLEAVNGGQVARLVKKKTRLVIQAFLTTACWHGLCTGVFTPLRALFRCSLPFPARARPNV